MATNNTTLQSLLNQTSLSFFRKTPIRGFVGEMLFQSRMVTPSDKKADSSWIATDNGEIELAKLPNNAMLAYTVTIITVNHSSNFKHDMLKAHNVTTFEKESVFTVYTDGKTITMNQTTHLGQEIDASQVLALLNLGAKLGKQAKTIAKWRKAKGAYERLVNGTWEAIVKPKTDATPIATEMQASVNGVAQS